MRCLALAFVAAVTLPVTHAVSTSSAVRANPIRRVVNMLQAMQVKIEEEGQKQTNLFDEFMCGCKNNGNDLKQGIDAAEARVPQLESSIKEIAAEKLQLESDVTQHKQDREDAKTSISQATAARTKAAADFGMYSTETTSNIKAMEKAIGALEKGMGGAFLQSSDAATLGRAVSTADLGDGDREILTSFLSTGTNQNSAYAPVGGEVTGILKQLKETMENELVDETATEETSKTGFASLETAKKKELDVLSKAIEEKMVRIGDAGVELVNANEDHESTSTQLKDDTQVYADLEASCASKRKEWEEISKTRSEELLAIAETIKILNDDDALDLFKQTLPSSSLLQLSARQRRTFRTAATAASAALRRTGVARQDAMAFVQRAVSAVRHGGKRGLRGRLATGGFDKVLKMTDDMVELLKAEGVNDANKKVYCQKEIDTADDSKKELELAISDLDKVVDNSKSNLAATIEEIATLKAGIAANDVATVELTTLRKKDNALYQEEMQSNNAAKELLDIAKNRLQKFYNPKLHTTTPGPEQSEEERISSAFSSPSSATSFLQLSSNSSSLSDVDRAQFLQYVKKTEESGGVIAMIDLLMADLAKIIQESEVGEKHAQASYEEELRATKEKRASDMRFTAEKEGQKAETEASLHKTEEERKGKTAEAMANAKYIASLHQECDWLLQNFGIRKEARAGEVESLKKAKAVLSGADYS